MTIAAAYLTSEGVVFGADSATTITARINIPGQPSQDRVSQILYHAQKVYEIGESGRLGLCTWGAGKIHEISHRTIAARVADIVNSKKTTVSQAVDIFVNEVKKAYGTTKDFPVGYFFGGWSPESHLPSCFRLVFDENGTLTQDELSVGEVRFSGSSEFFTRVFWGFDPSLPKELFDELVRRIPDLPDNFQDAFNESYSVVAGKLVVKGYQDLPIREAIDYVHSYLHITIKVSKYRFGPQPVGGPIEVGFISTDRNFRWACHKKHTSAISEQETTTYE